MEIYHEIWPVDEERGSIVIVHGAGEYFVRYHWLVQQLNEAGYSVFGGDLPGLGRTKGRKGHIERFEAYYAAVDTWIERASKRKRPLFLLGHSMGGLIVARYAEAVHPDVDGIILSSPCFGLSRNISPALEGIASILNRITPAFRLSAGIKAGDVSRDQTVTLRYTEDPHITTKVSVRWYKELQKAMRLAKEEIEDYPDVPTLVMQAGADRIVSPTTTKLWMDSLPISCKRYVEWPDCYHEIFNEPEKNEVINTLLQWMQTVKFDE
ncbi:alpha/beta hydrolase [Aneurinibacillus sp. REN35]|uniref:alpha/beta hydrolase n=1 Tax=Aneurinibacillus sp. REN35 TaxID=3237286 RepID=UPI003527766A